MGSPAPEGPFLLPPNQDPSEPNVSSPYVPPQAHGWGLFHCFIVFAFFLYHVLRPVQKSQFVLPQINSSLGFTFS